MKILIATPILYDPTSPFNHLLKDILQGLLDAGHEVTRIVATESADDTAYTMGLDGIRYIPILRKKSEKANIIQRYLTDTLTALRMARAIKKESADVLFEDVCYSSFWCVRAARKKRMRIVSMLQDVWPDNAVQSGLISDGSLIYRYFEFWQRRVYALSDRLICISDDIKSFIAQKSVSPHKIDVIYNWGYADEPVNIPREENAFLKKYELDPQKFYAVYAGNIGRMQNVELLVAAAERLREREDIHFLIIGDGVKAEDIRAAVAGLPNVTMLPLQPSTLATAIYSAAGVNLIPLVDGGVKTALPSKTGVVLSCGRPAIFCFGDNSAFADTVAAYGAGMTVSATDPAPLAAAIAALAASENAEPCHGATALFSDRFTRSVNVKRYAQLITNMEK